MRVVDFIALMDSDVTPDRTKIHLATWNGAENPLDVYREGRFDEWQRWQSKRNFERPLVIALIALPSGNQWLYAGVHTSEGCEWLEDHKAYYYKLQERESCSEFNGRLLVRFARTGRQPYVNADRWADQLLVDGILPERMSIGEFPGFKAVDLPKADLDVVVTQGLESWRVALSNVAGVYLISSPTTGKLYVGSASGEGGIWQRWCQYAASGHGGNVELRRLLENELGERADALRFSVLEIADVHASNDDIMKRESHWKRILLTRTHGLNAN